MSPQQPTAREWCPPCGEYHYSFKSNPIVAEHQVREDVKHCMLIAERRRREAEQCDTQELPRAGRTQ